jgi:choloylglycine hydrolase
VSLRPRSACPATSRRPRGSFHILNNFDIPVGAVRDEYTLWTSAEDLQNLQFFCKTFQDQTLRSVDGRKTLAASGGKIGELGS